MLEPLNSFMGGHVQLFERVLYSMLFCIALLNGESVHAADSDGDGLQDYQIAAGDNHTCALDDNGVQCWGGNDYGQATVPTDLVNPVAVSAGGAHTCALDDNGVHCWGGNWLGVATVPTGV